MKPKSKHHIEIVLNPTDRRTDFCSHYKAVACHAFWRQRFKPGYGIEIAHQVCVPFVSSGREHHTQTRSDFLASCQRDAAHAPTGQRKTLHLLTEDNGDIAIKQQFDEMRDEPDALSLPHPEACPYR
jgi:hypothetical protein